MKKLVSFSLAFGAFALFPSLASAQAPEKVSAFVCPTITAEAVGEHNPQASALGDTGDYTVVPATANNGDLYVPVHATNGDGEGEPAGDHSVPGDTDYSAIWAR